MGFSAGFADYWKKPEDTGRNRRIPEEWIKKTLDKGLSGKETFAPNIDLLGHRNPYPACARGLFGRKSAVADPTEDR